MEPFSGVCAVCGTINQMRHARCVTCGNPLPTASNKRVFTAPPVFSPLNMLLHQRYHVIQAIGQGGMGTVYVGKDTHLRNRLVAIKEMSQNHLSPLERRIAAKNFQREAHLLAELEYPHLPSIYDYFAENHRWYLVMSFVKGQTLAHYLAAQGGRLPVGEVLGIGSVLCDVLHYLHTHHPPIVFRDVKPSNIMRTGEGHLYLIDFGVARFFKPGQTTDTSHQGTSGYAAPEQYGTTQTTPRSDLYSLGVTLYQLLSGYEPSRTPFQLPPLGRLVPTAPTPLVTLITQMLDLDESKRPQRADMVKRELQRISNHFNSTHPPPASVKRNTGSLATLPAQNTSGSFPSTSASLTRVKVMKRLSLILVVMTIVVVFVASYVVIAKLTKTTPPVSNTSTPDGVVNAFCHALNSPTPDFQAAYDQFSRRYQQEHSLFQFQKYFQGTFQCTVASPSNGEHQAGVSLTMTCPQRPPPPDRPPRPNGPPRNPVNLTLIDEGSNRWKIDTMDVVGYRCDLPAPSTPAN